LSGIVEAMQKVAAAEVRKLHLSELGVVTSVFPHSSDSDKENYECNVKLKDKGVELRKVPIATSQIGMVNPPHVGDLVLLCFVNGDINSPVVVGRLYNDEDRPPTSKAEELVYVLPYEKDSESRRVYFELPEANVTLTIQDEQILLHVGETDITIDGDKVSLTTKKPVSITTEDDFSIKAKNIKLESDSDTEIKASGTTTIKGSTVDINP
jgi:uncharacterized protein involved in type VI secretion and phage assembly